MPSVATNEGMPNLTTMTPFRNPTSPPAIRLAIKANGKLSVNAQTLVNATIPTPIMEGNDKSISPAMTMSVSGRAMTAKKGIVDIYAA